MVEVKAMSETWEQVAEVLALLPWVAFIAAIAWFAVLELRDNARDSRSREPEHSLRSAKQTERGPSTNI